MKLKNIFMTAILALLILPMSKVFANQVLKAGFIKNEYTVCRFPGENIFGNSDGSITFSDEPLYGKSEIDFDFLISDANVDESIGISAENILNSADGTDFMNLIFTGSGTNASLKIENNSGELFTVCGDLEIDTEYSVTIGADLENNIYNVILYKYSERTELVNYRENLPIGLSAVQYGLKSISASADGGVSVCNLTVKREKTASGTSSANVHEGFICVGANTQGLNTGDGYSIILAFYNGGRTAVNDVMIKDFVYDGKSCCRETVFITDTEFKNKNFVSVFVFKKENLQPLSRSKALEIVNNAVIPQNALVYTGFEASESFSPSYNTAGGSLPSGWAASAWQNASGAPFDIQIGENGLYGSYAKIGAVRQGFMGLISPAASLPESGIKVSYDVSCSADFEGNVPRVFVLYYDDSNRFVNSGSFTDLDGAAPGDWEHCTLTVSPADYAAGASKFSVVFAAAYKSGEYGGSVYYDNIAIDDTVFNMQCTEDLSWYTPGGIICYRPKYGLSGKVTDVYGNVYNSDGELTDSIACSREDVIQNGWTYTPQESGFYSVVFYAVTADGSVLNEDGKYKAYFDADSGKNYYFERNRHDFYVSAFESKDMPDRNPLFGLSIGNTDGVYDVGIADKTGMSYVRLHGFMWSEIEPENVTADNGKSYNWGNYDKIFENIRSYDGKLRVIGNMLHTPQWASEVEDSSGYLVPMYARYAPKNMNDFKDFIDDLYARYGSSIDTWEIYNEPHLPGGSVFWNDTPENYISLLQCAYNELKILSGGSDTVTMGGIGAKRYLSFYRQFVEKGGMQYTDKLAMHGYDVDPWNYLKINRELGSGADKGVINTEAHIILMNNSSQDYYLTEKEVALRMVNDILRQIKYGIEKITFFSAYDGALSGEDIYRLDSITDGWSLNVSGLYRSRPDYEPRFAAGVLNTLISVCGKKVTYCDEYKMGDVNAVYLKSDGLPLIVFWADGLKKAEIPVNLGNILADADIADWEGRSISSDGFSLDADRVYFAYGFDGTALEALQSAKGQNVYDGAVLYSENEVNKKSASTLIAYETPNCLFSHDNGEVTQNDVVWNIFSNAEESKFAFSFCDDGLDMVVRVKNVSPYFTGDKNGDNLIIGFDTFANGIVSDVAEFTIYTDSSMNSTVIKETSPSICGDLPDNYNGAGEEVSGAVCFTENEGGFTLYRVHIPVSQLYPYFHTQNSDISFGLNYSDYNADGICIKQSFWSAGEFYTKHYPWNFGRAYISGYDFTDKIETTVKIGADESLAVEVYSGDDMVYFNQYEADGQGNCRIDAVLEKSGVYALKMYSKSTGYSVKKIRYTKTN